MSRGGALVGVAAIALAVLTGCTPEPGRTGSAPPDTAVPFASPAGGSDTDFDVDSFDPCSPFAAPLWRRAAPVDPVLAPQAVPEPTGGCRWRGSGMTATVAVESGRSLRDFSTDPAFRPGQRGWDGNSYWRTAAWDGTRACHAILAVGRRGRIAWCTWSSRPRRSRRRCTASATPTPACSPTR